MTSSGSGAIRTSSGPKPWKYFGPALALSMQACAASTVSKVTKTCPAQWYCRVEISLACWSALYSRCFAAATRAAAFLRFFSG